MTSHGCEPPVAATRQGQARPAPARRPGRAVLEPVNILPLRVVEVALVAVNRRPTPRCARTNTPGTPAARGSPHRRSRAGIRQALGRLPGLERHPERQGVSGTLSMPRISRPVPYSIVPVAGGKIRRADSAGSAEAGGGAVGRCGQWLGAPCTRSGRPWRSPGSAANRRCRCWAYQACRVRSLYSSPESHPSFWSPPI